MYRDGLDPGESYLGTRLGRADQPVEAGASCTFGGDESAHNGPEPSIECELPERRVPGQRARWELPGRCEHRQGDRDVEAEPSLRRKAGARLTVMRPSGHRSSADEMPLRTRSLASWQARSASPTIAKAGVPSCRCASTSTLRGSSPTSAWVTVRASTLPR